METAERGEKQVLMVKRLEDGLLDKRKGDVSTPPPQWRLELLCQSRGKEFLDVPSSSSLSARKLCATLWKIEPHQRHLPAAEMAGKYNSNDKRNKGVELPLKFIDSPDNSSRLVAAENSLRRDDIPGSMMQNQCRRDMADLSLHRVSHARDDCAIKVAARRSAVGLTSLDFPRRLSESNSRTSAELLKVVDRIRRLEVRHAPSISFAEGLKVELEDNQASVRKLLQEKALPYDRNNKQNRNRSVESLMEELESERKLRNRSEILHRKAARELSEIKSCFSEAMKELEREKKERIVLENLCDGFAKGVRDYEKEVRSLKHKADEDWLCGRTHDGLILQISEAWLDERMQAKLEETKNNSTVNKLHSDIESFLQAKRGKKLGSSSPPPEVKENCSCRHSLESYQLNDAGSAPKNMADEEDYSESDSQCTEKTKRGDGQGMLKSSSSRKNMFAARNQCETRGEKQRSTDNLGISENSKQPARIKENTLMAKLLEARLHSKSRASV